MKLDLCDNSFANKASHGALYRALGSTTSLTYLNLRDCDLGDDGVQKICHALFESDSALEHLDLSGNCLEKRGAKHIADYIRDCGGEYVTPSPITTNANGQAYTTLTSGTRSGAVQVSATATVQTQAGPRVVTTALSR